MMIIISMGMVFNNLSLMYLLLSLEWFLILLLLTLLPMLTFSGGILFLIMAISSSIMGLVLFMLSLASFGQNLFLFYKNKLCKTSSLQI